MHVSGHVDELPILEDSEFGVAERCMKLVRMVEMYQYTEHKTTSTRKDGRGGEIRETVRVCVCVCMSVCSQVGCHSHSSSRRTGGAIMIPQNYHYTSEWSSRPIPSSRFDDPSFSNPTVRCACFAAPYSSLDAHQCRFACQHWPLQSSTEAARTVRMGAWQLDKHVLDHVGVTHTVDLARQDIPLLVRDSERCCGARCLVPPSVATLTLYAAFCRRNRATC